MLCGFSNIDGQRFEWFECFVFEVTVKIEMVYLYILKIIRLRMYVFFSIL